MLGRTLVFVFLKSPYFFHNFFLDTSGRPHNCLKIQLLTKLGGEDRVINLNSLQLLLVLYVFGSSEKTHIKFSDTLVHRYASEYASTLLKKLYEDGIYMRPLGNVIYLMCGPCTSPIKCQRLLEILYKRLEEFGEEQGVGVASVQ